ncbi:MAG: elongation factor G [Phycisphaerales bacterium]|nr:elongation factor G [Phycisphaerales bacterium]
MGSVQTADIRNVLLCGPQGSGKTTLIERMLAHTKTITKMGTVQTKDTACDFEPEEKSHQHSLTSKVVYFNHEGRQITLIDSPGAGDFLGHAIAAMAAVDSVILTIDATRGIESTTRRLFKIARGQGLPVLLLVTKIDHTESNLPGLLDRIHEVFGTECIPINLPIKNNTDVVDVFDHSSADGKEDSEIMSVAEAHQHIFEQVVEMDEELTGEYFEKGDKLDPAKLHRAMEAALTAGHLVPVAFCSAKTGAGIDDLDHIIAQQLPSPAESHPPLPHMTGAGADGGEFHPDVTKPTAPCVAVVWKVVNDPFVGKLAFVRVLQGTLASKSEITHGENRRLVRVGHLLKVRGKDHHECDSLAPGEIGVIAKVDELKVGSVLHADASVHLHPAHLPTPVPLSGLAIELKNHADESKFTNAIHKMSEEDPCFHMERVAATNQTVLKGCGELHLRIMLEKLKNRYHIELTTKPMKVAYKETISGRADGHCRHKKQTGGSGQFGEVFLRVEPLPADHATGFEFVNDTVGGSIPRQYMPAIEKGIRQVLNHGAFAGYPMTGVKVSVYDGKYHDVDSKEIAFLTAGRKAFIDAIAKAKPTLMEPVVKLAVAGPAARMGDLTAEVSGKRGRIEGTDLDGDQCIVTAVAPLAELSTFASELKSLTAGAGSYEMEFSHYERTPPAVQQQVMAAFKPKEDEE